MRDYYYSDELKQGFYPIEEEYPILKDYCLPDVKELICYTSSLNPYELTHEILEKLSNIKISTSQIQKVTNSIGRELINNEEDFITNPVKINNNMKIIDKLVISMDGAMINTYNDWKEVKTGALYELEKKGKEIKSIKKSYISKIEDHISFRKRIKAEAIRRNYSVAKELIVIGDGARQIWDLAEIEFPRSVKILDWYHAKERLYHMTSLLFPDKNKPIKPLMEKLEDLLYSGNINRIIEIINEMKCNSTIFERTSDLASLQTEEEYFIKNQNKMMYSYFESIGYPIGSGVIEGACKQVVQLRLKRNGMKWKINKAQGILKLRTMYLSNRWNEVLTAIRQSA